MSAEDFARKILEMATEYGVSSNDVCRATDAVRVMILSKLLRQEEGFDGL